MGLEKGINGLIGWQRNSPEIHPNIPKIFFKDKHI